MVVDLGSAFAAAFIGLVIYGAITDVKGLKIPNWISIALVLLFAAYLGFGGRPPLPAFQHVGVALAVLVVGFAAFAGGYMGAGDVKLMAAVALWAGPSKAIALIFFTALAGAGLALLILAGTFYLRWDGSGTAPNSASRLFPRWVRRGIVPYGVAICLGSLVTIPSKFL
jgi:prepilin peptidase CpaA